MKVCFVDVDGVLNSSRSVLARTGPLRTRKTMSASEALRKWYPSDDDRLPYGPRDTLETIDPVAVGLLNRLLRETQAALVLSSSHRGMFVYGTTYGSPTHMQALNHYLHAMGIEADLYGITPKLYVQRGAEVAQYMEEHNVTEAVILDDGKDFHASQPLVWCNPNVGFTHDNYFQASRLLGMPESSILF